MSTPDRGWIILAVSWPLFGFSAILVVLRVWVRTRIIKSWGWDDPFIILALLCATINTVLATIAYHYGTGRHAIDLSSYQQIESTKYNWLSQGFHVMSTNWGKVSVALFMLRISQRAKHHRPAMCTGIALLSIINVVCVYTIYGQCTPTSRLWDSDVHGSCWDPNVQKDYAFFQGSASALSDLLLAIYPLFTIGPLQMAIKVKIGLGFVLSLGVVAMVAAIVKTVNLAALSGRADYPWDTVDLTIWIAVEQYLIIIAACIPTLTPLFNIVVRRRTTRRSSSNNKPCQTGTNSGQSGKPPLHGPFATGGKGPREACAWTENGDSDEEPIILPGQSQEGILMTTDIHVQTGSGLDNERMGTESV